MSMELASPVQLYDKGPLTLTPGHSYSYCVQYFRDVQNQALEVAAQELISCSRPSSAKIVRAFKYPPKPDPRMDAIQKVVEAMDELEAIEGVPKGITVSGCYRQALWSALGKGE